MILTCILASVGLSVAQTTRVSGTVIDDTGETVIGASVVAKGTTVGTVTDIDGNFTLNVPSDKKTLVISLIGYKTKEVPAGTGIKVTMESDTKLIDEVVVVAYGTTTKSTFTGSASTVGNNILKDSPVASFEQALQGASPGLAITSSSGQPGSAQAISLRGIGSMNASTEPLYVIDGVPMVPENLSVSGVADSPGSLGISSLINTSDIESITVLKDAAAAALYGSRGANGVIMITTKSGKNSGKVRVSLKATVGFNDWAVETRPIIGGDELRELWAESYYNYLTAGSGKNNTSEANWAEAWEVVDEYAPRPADGNYYDWEKALFKKRGSVQTYDATISGGSDKTKFFLSVGYKKEEGKAKGSELDQYTGRLNLTHDAGKLKLGTNVSFAKIDQSRISEGSAYANPYFATRGYLFPTTPIYNEDGTYYEGYLLNGKDNLVKSSDLDQYRNDLFNMKASVWAEYNLYEGLNFKQTVSYDYNTNHATTVWPMTGGNGAALNGLIIKLTPTYKKLYTSSLLTYKKSIGQHNLDFLLGWDVEKRLYDTVDAVGNNLASDNMGELIGAATPKSVFSESTDDRMLSGLSRLNYNYADKYYISLTGRRDGSTRFGKNKRWGTFWSVSGSWRVTEEEFMKGITAISDMKVRGSYGLSGTLPKDLYGSITSYAVDGGNYADKAGVYPARISNPDLSWEKNHILDLGLDLRLFDRLTFEFDFYNRTTKDLLMEVPVSQTTGFSNYLKNVGEMNNKGIEFAIGMDVFNTKDFSWNTRFNLSHNKNKITKLDGGKQFADAGYSMLMRREGEAYNSIYLREFAGVNPETGAEQWYTNTTLADGTIEREITEDPNKATRVIVAKVDPDVTGGWLNTFRYKGFDLSALISFSIGGHFYNNGWHGATNGYYDFTLLPDESQMDRWQKPGDNTSVGKRVYGYDYGNYGSSKWVHSSTHARLKNVTLGYTVPQDLVRKASLNSIRFLVTGTNLLTVKKTDGFDPEVPQNGMVGYSFPNLKSVVFGVEVTF